jgi:hypothetical protein
VPYEKQVALSQMVSTQNITTAGASKTLYIPLRFWFNNNVGAALPLLALQYNDVKFEIKFKSSSDVNVYSHHGNHFNDPDTATNLINDTEFKVNQVRLLCEYIHLDKDERRLFMSNSHEYLITQVQTSLTNPVNLYPTVVAADFKKIHHKCDLRFNHPVKELVWTFQDSNARIKMNANAVATGDYYNKGILSYNYWNGYKVGNDQMIGASLVLNGKEITEELPPSFYRNIQQYQYHSGTKLKSIIDNTDVANKPDTKYISYQNGTGLYSYSFCLSPEESQPSGSLNFSNLEMAQLKYRLDVAEAGTLDGTDVEVLAKDDTGTLTLTDVSGPIDGEAFTNGGDYLLSNQTSGGNGIYTFTTGTGDEKDTLARKTGFTTNADFVVYSSAKIYNVSVTNGTINKGKTFTMGVKTADLSTWTTLDTHPITVTDSTFKLQSKVLTIYAVNYNILRVMSGMASLLFSS